MNPENASSIKYDLIEAAGQKVLFTPLRIDRDSVPKELYCYDLRHGDDDSMACTIEKSVFVNHFGTILCSKPFDLESQQYLELEDSIDFLSVPETTLQDFQEKGALRLVVEYGMENASKEFSCVDMNANSYILQTLWNARMICGVIQRSMSSFQSCRSVMMLRSTSTPICSEAVQVNMPMRMKWRPQWRFPVLTNANLKYQMSTTKKFKF